MFSKPSICGCVCSWDLSPQDLEVAQFTSIVVMEKCFQHEMYCFPCHTVKQQKIAENGNVRKKKNKLRMEHCQQQQSPSGRERQVVVLGLCGHHVSSLWNVCSECVTMAVSDSCSNLMGPRPEAGLVIPSPLHTNSQGWWPWVGHR